MFDSKYPNSYDFWRYKEITETKEVRGSWVEDFLLDVEGAYQDDVKNDDGFWYIYNGLE